MADTQDADSDVKILRKELLVSPSGGSGPGSPSFQFCARVAINAHMHICTYAHMHNARCAMLIRLGCMYTRTLSRPLAYAED